MKKVRTPFFSKKNLTGERLAWPREGLDISEPGGWKEKVGDPLGKGRKKKGFFLSTLGGDLQKTLFKTGGDQKTSKKGGNSSRG